MDARELIILPALKANRGPGGGLVLTQKYLEGTLEYAKAWPGPVTTLAEVVEERSTDMDHVEVLPGSYETGLEERPADDTAIARRLESAAVVLGFLGPAEAETLKLCRRIGVPMVGISEYSPRTERQIVDASTRNPLLRLRRRLWLHKTERTRQRMLPDLAGLQCSGVPTYDLYRPRQPNALLFFDNRIWLEDVISEQILDTRLARVRDGQPLKLIFGGRLIATKGVRQLPEIAHALTTLDIPFSLEIYGSGPLETELQGRIEALGLADQVQLKGALDFRTGWVPVLQKDTDLFICCHPQGDPSSTYPEVMSCGVPIVGFDNEAFVGIVKQSNAGWMSPTGDALALAREIARLHQNRAELADAAFRARSFAMQHTFETTFARRTRHLIQSSRLPDSLKV